MDVQPLALSPTLTGYLLSSVVAMPLSGWFSGKFGARRTYLFAIALFMLHRPPAVPQARSGNWSQLARCRAQREA